MSGSGTGFSLSYDNEEAQNTNVCPPNFHHTLKGILYGSTLLGYNQVRNQLAIAQQPVSASSVNLVNGAIGENKADLGVKIKVRVYHGNGRVAKTQEHLLTGDERKPLFILLNTPVMVEPSALLTPLNMVGLGLWLAGPGQPWSKRLRLGGLMLLTYALTDLLHFGGHIVSSRYAGAPMDRVHLAAPFPYAEYLDNDVSPQAHRLRSVGGPLANALACLLSVGLGPFTPANSVRREWLTMSRWLNGLIAVGSLLPLPFIDGGVILKWTLVERGYSRMQPIRRFDRLTWRWVEWGL